MVENTKSVKKVAFLVAAEGIEQAELVEPWAAVTDAGHEAVLLSPASGEVQLFEHLDKAGTRPVDATVGEAAVGDYDALVLPGGVANPDALRTDAAAVAFVQAFVESGKAGGRHLPRALDADRGRRRRAAGSSRPGRACRPICETPAPPGSTSRSSPTAT